MNFLLKAKKFSYIGKKKKKDCYQYRYQTRYASAEADDCFLVEMLYDDGTLLFLFGYLLVLKHVSTCRRILLQKDSAFEMRSAKEQDIISNSKHCINAMTSYQFRVIVGLSISSHCRPINF